MIVIRLTRLGRINSPFYRIVVANKRSKRDAKPIAVVGSWNPVEKKLEINKEKVNEWVKKGAKLSATVTRLLA